MASIYNFHDELTAITAEDMATGDLTILFDTSAQIPKKVLMSDFAAYVRTFGGGVVNTTASALTITAPLHSGKIVTISSSTPIVVTLPATAGTGNRYRLQFQVVATATVSTIKVANATDIMQGMVQVYSTVTATLTAFRATATSDTMTFNGSTLGGVVGDWYEFIDVKTGFWQVNGLTAPTGSEVTPFGTTVS